MKTPPALIVAALVALWAFARGGPKGGTVGLTLGTPSIVVGNQEAGMASPGGSISVNLPVTLTGNNAPATVSMTVNVRTEEGTLRGSRSASWGWSVGDSQPTKSLSVSIADLGVIGGTKLYGTITVSWPGSPQPSPLSFGPLTVPSQFGNLSVGSPSTSVGAQARMGRLGI